jgi:hypothetical protein
MIKLLIQQLPGIKNYEDLGLKSFLIFVISFKIIIMTEKNTTMYSNTHAAVGLSKLKKTGR